MAWRCGQVAHKKKMEELYIRENKMPTPRPPSPPVLRAPPRDRPQPRQNVRKKNQRYAVQLSASDQRGSLCSPGSTSSRGAQVKGMEELRLEALMKKKAARIQACKVQAVIWHQVSGRSLSWPPSSL
jgi:hypothetical protein